MRFYSQQYPINHIIFLLFFFLFFFFSEIQSVLHWNIAPPVKDCVEKIRKYLQFDASGHDDRPEGQRVRADRCNHDRRYRRMNHAGPSRNSIRRRPGRRAYDQAITLYTGHMFTIDEEVDVWEIWGRTSIHHDLVQHQ